MTGTNSTSICERTRCERNENTSISSGVTDTSAISQRCNPGALYGGATYRLELQCYHLAGKSERKKKQQQPQQQQQQGIINVVQCKGGHPFVDPTEGPTRPLVYMKSKIPSEYYLLRSETLQDIAMNAMFNNYGCGHDDLPPPLQRMYHNHIYIITITNTNDKTIQRPTSEVVSLSKARPSACTYSSLISLFNH